MLVTTKNQPIKVSDHLNSKSHPHVFAPLRETKDVLDHKKVAGFSIETRAWMK